MPKGKKKPPTKPWDGEESRERNEYQSRMLRAPKRGGFKCYWEGPLTIDRALAKGWKIADFKHYPDYARHKPGESDSLTTEMRRREMVLVEMPLIKYNKMKKEEAEAKRVKEQGRNLVPEGLSGEGAYEVT